MIKLLSCELITSATIRDGGVALDLHAAPPHPALPCPIARDTIPAHQA